MKKVVIKALRSNEIAHRETGVMPDEVYFAKTLGLVLKIECHDLRFNKLHLNQNNVRQNVWYTPLLTGHSSPSSKEDPEQRCSGLGGHRLPLHSTDSATC